MKFSTGDKVSFINEKQNGTVVRVFPGGKVLVEIEDGFEIEVMEKELVKTGGNNYKDVPEEQPETAPVMEEKTDSLLALCNEGSLCFAGVPAATGAVLTGMVNFFLINNTDYDLVYTFFEKKKNKLNGISRGIMERKSEKLIECFLRNDLTDVESFLIEALIYYNDIRPAVTHIRKETAVLLPGISHSHQGMAGVAAFARVVEIFTEKEPEPEMIKDLIEKLDTRVNALHPVVNKPSAQKDHSNKYGIHVNEKVVDLHIEELQPDFSGLSNAEIITIQLKHFAKEMDNAIRNHYKRIIFIHGVGNGVLKRELRAELRKYNGVTIRDGDFSRYGYGATEVMW